MGVVFYRAGDTHTVNGIKCELTVIHPKRTNGEPPDGWYKTPEEAYEPKEKVKEVINIDELEDDELRDVAEIAGIENFDSARFKTLRRELKEWQQAT